MNYFVAVVLACTAELQKSVSVSGSLRAAKQAANGIWARVTAGGGAPVDSASSRRRSASCSSSDRQEERMINEKKDKTMDPQESFPVSSQCELHFNKCLTHISCLIHGNGQLDNVVHSLGILGFLWLLAYDLLFHQEAESFWWIHARPTVPLSNIKKSWNEWMYK